MAGSLKGGLNDGIVFCLRSQHWKAFDMKRINLDREELTPWKLNLTSVPLGAVS